MESILLKNVLLFVWVCLCSSVCALVLCCGQDKRACVCVCDLFLCGGYTRVVVAKYSMHSPVCYRQPTNWKSNIFLNKVHTGAFSPRFCPVLLPVCEWIPQKAQWHLEERLRKQRWSLKRNTWSWWCLRAPWSVTQPARAVVLSSQTIQIGFQCSLLPWLGWIFIHVQQNNSNQRFKKKHTHKRLRPLQSD